MNWQFCTGIKKMPMYLYGFSMILKDRKVKISGQHTLQYPIIAEYDEETGQIVICKDFYKISDISNITFEFI